MGIVCCMAGNQLDWLGFNCYSNNKFLFGRLQTCKTGDLMYSNTPPLQWVSSDQVGYPFAWSSPSPPISHISPCLLWVMVIISSRGRHNGWGGVGNYPLHKSTISGPTPASFLFRSYQTQYYRKTCRLKWDSKSDRRKRRRKLWPLDHHHSPLTGCVSVTLFRAPICIFPLMKLWTIVMLVLVWTFITIVHNFIKGKIQMVARNDEAGSMMGNVFKKFFFISFFLLMCSSSSTCLAIHS